MRMTTAQAMATFLSIGAVLMVIASQLFVFYSIEGLLSAATIYFGLRYIIRNFVVIDDGGDDS